MENNEELKVTESVEATEEVKAEETVEAASEETREVVFNLFESLGIFNKEEKTKENE